MDLARQRLARFLLTPRLPFYATPVTRHFVSVCVWTQVCRSGIKDGDESATLFQQKEVKKGLNTYLPPQATAGGVASLIMLLPPSVYYCLISPYCCYLE